MKNRIRKSDVFEDKVKKYSKRPEVRVKRIHIKNLKNRWGSLTKE
jgi:predicted metal-dependent hydrolase